jgi:hypothetical protein
MEYRTGKMKSLNTRLKNLIDRFELRIIGLMILLIASFILINYRLLGPSLDQVVLGVILGVLLSTLSIELYNNIESRIKINKLKPYILSELEFILISLIINFARLYVIYFEFLKLYDFNKLFQIIEKRKENITNCLFCLLFKEIYSLRNKLNDFHYILETEKETKPIIKQVHMTLFISVLTSLTVSSFERTFVKNMLHIWHEINELNKEIEVLEGLSQPDPSLIQSISQRIERIAIKIDEILEKERTNL